MFIDNPTEGMLVNIRQMQQATLARLNAQPHWDEDDFNCVFLCYHDWYPELNDWAINRDDLLLLMNDPRTPASKLERIRVTLYQKILRHLADRSN